MTIIFARMVAKLAIWTVSNILLPLLYTCAPLNFDANYLRVYQLSFAAMSMRFSIHSFLGDNLIIHFFLKRRRSNFWSEIFSLIIDLSPHLRILFFRCFWVFHAHCVRLKLSRAREHVLFQFYFLVHTITFVFCGFTAIFFLTRYNTRCIWGSSNSAIVCK